jgi:plasmid maintenance system antidote protein VapI
MSDSVGEMLQQGLDDAGMSQALLAYGTGLSAKHINWLIKGRARLSVEVAVRIEMMLPDISAEALLIAQVRQELADYVNQLP